MPVENRTQLFQEAHERLNVAKRLREAMSEGHETLFFSYGCPSLSKVFHEVLDGTQVGHEYMKALKAVASNGKTTVEAVLDNLLPHSNGVKL